MRETTISFLAPLPPIPLRRNRLTRNNGYARKLRREYSEDVFFAFMDEYGHAETASCLGCTYLHAPHRKHPTPWIRADLTLTWRHHRAGPDVPNVIDNCKALIDTLRCQQPSDVSNPKADTERYWLGLFRDDSADCLLSVTPKVEKVTSKAQEGVLVVITRRDGGRA